MADNANADTSAQDNKGKTPPSGSDTSAQTDQGQGAKPEVVTLTKEQYDEQQRQIAIGKEAQRRSEAYKRIYGDLGKKGSHFTSEPAPKKEEGGDGGQQPTPEERGAAEDRKAERLLLGVAVDPKYREILDADPTLRNLLTSNPLGVLPILAPDALDAEDALALVKEKLDAQVLELESKKKTTTDSKPEDKKDDKAPGTGAVNTQTPDQDAEYEAARKVGNTEQAIAGMIKVKAKKLAGK